jgi:CheY-like chemotaxis protein
METANNRKVIAGVPDLFFAAKIGETARQLGVTVEFASSEPVLAQKLLAGPALLILDLAASALRPIETIAWLKTEPRTSLARIIGFVNHERTDLIEQAREAGCDRILTRGAFAKELPELLRAVAQSAG